MKTKFGAIVVDGRGKLGGKVFSKNRYGSYEKIKVTPTNPTSAYSTQVRANYKAIVQSWSTLTDIQRASFNSGTKQFPQKNTFGDIHFLSGFGLYVSFNINRLLLSQSLLVSCPSPTTSHFIQSANVEAREIDNTVTLNFSPLCPAGYVYKINATTSLSPGINYSNRRFKLLGFINSSDASPFDLSSLYITRFGNIGNAGQKIFFKISAIEISSGIESQPYIFSTIILNSLDMLKNSITLTAPDIIGQVSRVLVPAPGANKIIVPISIVAKSKVGNIQWNWDHDNYSPELDYMYENGATRSVVVPNTYIDVPFDNALLPMSAQPGFGFCYDASPINQALLLFCTPGMTEGNGHFVVDCYYMINDF